MSENFQTEEEQIEAIKKWWAENGKSTVAGIAIALAAVFGWQGWQKQQLETSYAASSAYQNLLQVVEQGQGQLAGEQLSTAQHLAETLKNDFSSSVYAQFAAFYKAQFAVNAKDLEQAEAELRWILGQRPSAEMAVQAHLRLAKVLLAKGQYDEALAELGGDALGYQALYLELKGDIYLAKGDAELARQSYQDAKAASMNTSASPANNLLELKMQQLPAANEE